jgi:hypothetical protein
MTQNEANCEVGMKVLSQFLFEALSLSPEALPIIHGYRYLGGRKKLTLITELCSAYMEALFYVSRGKIGEGDTGKTDYRHHARTECV